MAVDTNAFVTQLTNFYQTGLNWNAPSGYGASGNYGTAINTSTPFDTSAANANVRNQADWFGAMQGSFNSSFNFLNTAFQRQQQFLAPTLNSVVLGTNQLGTYVAETQRIIGKRSTRGGGLLSKLF